MKDRRRRRKWEGRWALALWVGDTEMDAVGSWRWGDAVMIRSQIYPWAPPPPTPRFHVPNLETGARRRKGRTALVNGPAVRVHMSWGGSSAVDYGKVGGDTAALHVCLDTPNDLQHFWCLCFPYKSIKKTVKERDLLFWSEVEWELFLN